MRRQSRIVILAAGAVTSIVGASAWAVASTRDDSLPPLTAADVYSSDMSLQEIAKAATGRVGEIAPPCPSIEDGQKLKEAGIEFGPCDLNTSEGDPLIVPDVDEPRDDEGRATCPGVLQHNGYGVSLPCAVGAELIDVGAPRQRDGLLCADVTYRPSSKTEVLTENLCEGDTPRVGGDPVQGPTTIAEHEHEDVEHDHDDHEH